MNGKINVLTSDIFKKPQGQVLLIPHYSDVNDPHSLFNKVDQLCGNLLTKRSKQFSFKSKKGESFVVHDVEGKLGFDAVVIFGLGSRKAVKAKIFREMLARVLRKVAVLRFTSVAVVVDNELRKDFFLLGQVLSEALNLSQYRFDKYKSEESRKKQPRVEEMNVYLSTGVASQMATIKKEIDFGTIVADGVNFTRDLVNEPAQHVYPDTLAEEAKKIAKESRELITVKVLSRSECEKLGMGAYLAVAQGSDREPRFIILHYKPKGKAKSSFCLVGKSITFDSGGLSLKPSKSMETMKLDMAGGATVLGVFKILAKIGSPHEVYGVLPSCENMPSGRAIRPGDIVRALNGKTIEILNTDAEGRLILADGLSYAEKYLRPDCIIDIATLTGAIMVALGPDITGLFGTDRKYKELVKKAADAEGEELWSMPLFKPYLKKMRSDVADLKNISGSGYGGAITAALFLSEFVKKTPWIHLDIAGASFNEGEAAGLTQKGGTGWGVRTLVSILQS